jgi:hypothetical protein
MEFGEGQPQSALPVGYRISIVNGPIWTTTPPSNNFRGTILVAISAPASGDFNTYTSSVSCNVIQSLDQKMDDGSPIAGSFMPRDCNIGWPPTPTTQWNPSGFGSFVYDLKGF